MTAAPARLRAHLAAWLGAWPPRRPLRIVGATQREVPGWDGQVHPALGVASPDDGAVLSVPPRHAPAVRGLANTGAGAWAAALPELLGHPGRGTFTATFRWTLGPAPLPDAGTWHNADGPDVPDWLRPFGGQVLLAHDDDGQWLAGVGIKRHDRHGHELAVVTQPAANGRGLARRLVAQAARRVLDHGAIPTYLHDPANLASARVAVAAGFTDAGWTSFGLRETARASTPGRLIRRSPPARDAASTHRG